MSTSYTRTKLVADLLSFQLADPRNPTHCYACFAGVMGVLNAELVGHLARLRVECHAFFDACAVIVCIRRTPDELASLPLRIAANRGSYPVHGLDRSSPPLTPDAHLHAFVKSAAYIVCAAVALGEHAFIERAVSGRKAFADDIDGRWPAREEQLFPGGVHAALDGLLATCELYVSEGPIAVLAHMIDVARPHILPVLSSDPFRTQLVDVELGLVRSVDWYACQVHIRMNIDDWLRVYVSRLRKLLFIINKSAPSGCKSLR